MGERGSRRTYQTAHISRVEKHPNVDLLGRECSLVQDLEDELQVEAECIDMEVAALNQTMQVKTKAVLAETDVLRKALAHERALLSERWNQQQAPARSPKSRPPKVADPSMQQAATCLERIGPEERRVQQWVAGSLKLVTNVEERTSQLGEELQAERIKGESLEERTELPATSIREGVSQAASKPPSGLSDGFSLDTQKSLDTPSAADELISQRGRSTSSTQEAAGGAAELGATPASQANQAAPSCRPCAPSGLEEAMAGTLPSRVSMRLPGDARGAAEVRQAWGGKLATAARAGELPGSGESEAAARGSLLEPCDARGDAQQRRRRAEEPEGEGAAGDRGFQPAAKAGGSRKSSHRDARGPSSEAGAVREQSRPVRGDLPEFAAREDPGEDPLLNGEEALRAPDGGSQQEPRHVHQNEVELAPGTGGQIVHQGSTDELPPSTLQTDDMGEGARGAALRADSSQPSAAGMRIVVGAPSEEGPLMQREEVQVQDSARYQEIPCPSAATPAPVPFAPHRIMHGDQTGGVALEPQAVPDDTSDAPAPGAGAVSRAPGRPAAPPRSKGPRGKLVFSSDILPGGHQMVSTVHQPSWADADPAPAPESTARPPDTTGRMPLAPPASAAAPNILPPLSDALTKTQTPSPSRSEGQQNLPSSTTPSVSIPAVAKHTVAEVTAEPKCGTAPQASDLSAAAAASAAPRTQPPNDARATGERSGESGVKTAERITVDRPPHPAAAARASGATCGKASGGKAAPAVHSGSVGTVARLSRAASAFFSSIKGSIGWLSRKPGIPATSNHILEHTNEDMQPADCQGGRLLKHVKSWRVNILSGPAFPRTALRVTALGLIRLAKSAKNIKLITRWGALRGGGRNSKRFPHFSQTPRAFACIGLYLTNFSWLGSTSHTAMIQSFDSKIRELI
ncbi:hypothetical protein CYMTET_52133 [Cymbomonas tetramitiformis]|uniref:Uncharacterized protein n=1 Tax=Cymbomonas tetramitiformis TaxID=36881 RepID=A0AAE0ERY6_9CHLO|nr:hypothetical protein CYMTET_52133 [Cymbomonas tetramitiformis]